MLIHKHFFLASHIPMLHSISRIQLAPPSSSLATSQLVLVNYNEGVSIICLRYISTINKTDLQTLQVPVELFELDSSPAQDLQSFRLSLIKAFIPPRESELAGHSSLGLLDGPGGMYRMILIGAGEGEFAHF